MKFGVYAMKDNLSGFLTPTFEVNDDVAMRNFAYAVSHKDTLLYAEKKDFDLYKIGEYDSETGHLEPLESVNMLMQGSAVNV